MEDNTEKVDLLEIESYINNITFKKKFLGISETDALLKIKELNELYFNEVSTLDKNYKNKINMLMKEIESLEFKKNKLEEKNAELGEKINKYFFDSQEYLKKYEDLVLILREIKEYKSEIIKNARDEEVKKKEEILSKLNIKQREYQKNIEDYSKEYLQLKKQKKIIMNTLNIMMNDIENMMK